MFAFPRIVPRSLVAALGLTAVVVAAASPAGAASRSFTSNCTVGSSRG